MNHTEGVIVKEAKKTLPDGWRWVRLGEACEINPRRSASLQRADNAPTTFVPMSAVDERSASIVRVEVRPFADVQKGYTYFEESDVLFAKITPCMQNGKHAIARDLIGGVGFGTTEFHVLRPSPAITSEWIHCFLRQPTVLGAATAYFTGAVGQQRVPDSYLARLEIPLPPLPEQKHIAAMLNEQMAAVERARAAAEAQLVAAKALPAAYLRAVFNSPEAQGWPIRLLGEVCEGKTSTRDPRLEPDKSFRYVDITSIDNRAKRIVEAKTLGGNNAPSRARQVIRAGDVIVSTTRPNLNAVALVPPEFDNQICSTGFCVLRAKDSLDQLYLFSFVQTPDFVQRLSELVKGALYPAVTDKQVFAQFIPVPSLAEQQTITAILNDQMASAERTRKALEEQLDTINKLPAALLRRAFSGEL